MATVPFTVITASGWRKVSTGLLAEKAVLLQDGSAAAPSLAFANNPTTGIYTASNGIYFSTLGSYRAYIDSAGLVLAPASRTGTSAASAFTLAQTWNTTGVPVFVDWTITDTASDPAALAFRIRGGAAGTTELFKVSKLGSGTFAGGITIAAAQAVTWFGRGRMWMSASGVAYLDDQAGTGMTSFSIGPTTGNTASASTSHKHIETTLDMATATGTGTGTITSPNTALPAGHLIKGVVLTVTTTLTGAGLTTFSVGDGTDADRWGTGIAITAGTTTSIANFTTAMPAYQISAGSIVLTAAAGVFSTGVVKCSTIAETYKSVATS